jgi:hypothetical protein
MTPEKSATLLTCAEEQGAAVFTHFWDVRRDHDGNS